MAWRLHGTTAVSSSVGINYSKADPPPTAHVGSSLELNRIEKHKYVYVCGVASGPQKERYPKNFHLALRYEEGRSVSAVTYTNYVITAHNAVMLQIPTLPRDLLKDGGGNLLREGHIRCRNYQFAVAVFGHPSIDGAENDAGRGSAT